MNAPIPNAARILGQTGVLRADDGGRRRIGRCGGSTDVSYPLLRTPFYLSAAEQQNAKKPRAIPLQAPLSVCTYHMYNVRGGYCQGK